jgi:hypothetical protein
MLAEDPSVFGLIYILKFSYNFSYFIVQVSKNTSSNCGEVALAVALHSMYTVHFLLQNISKLLLYVKWFKNVFL